jgi:hypothetical protein
MRSGLAWNAESGSKALMISRKGTPSSVILWKKFLKNS